MANNTIFDDVFRTMLEKMPTLVIPLINEAFGTAYPDDIPIIQRRNEHQTKSGAIITDSHFLITDKVYHIECQSTGDSTMIIRMVEYDFAIALEYAEIAGKRYQMYFPHSCVLFLRGPSGSDMMEMDLIMPDGAKTLYRVPIIRMEKYTKDIIFQKHLLFLLPFYIIRYEKSKNRLDRNESYLHILLEEYRSIERHLAQELLYQNREKDYRDLIELISRIADYILADTPRVRKGIGEVMGGKVLELESDRIIAKAQENVYQLLIKNSQEDLISRDQMKITLSDRYNLGSDVAEALLKKYWK